MAPLLDTGALRFPCVSRALPAALLSLILVAGCTGDRTRSTGADTSGSAVVTPDSAAMPTADSAGKRDTVRASPLDTTARATVTPGAGKKKMGVTATKTAHDTAPAPPPQNQDTAKTTAQAQETGKQPPQAAEAPLRDAYHLAPRDTVTQAVYDGWKQFNLNCARCHGEDVLGTTIAPHLIVSLKPDGPINSKELFVQTVCAGRPAKGMPAWCALGLDMDKINDIYLYVKGRSDAKIGPGRPAVKPEG